MISQIEPPIPTTHPLWIFIFALALLLFVSATPHLFAQDDTPKYTGAFFTDLTGKVSTEEKVKISRTLRVAAESSRTHPMLVVINKMTAYPKMPQTINGFATRLAKSWKVGDQKTKKGVLILFSLGDRKFFVAKTKNIEQKTSDAIRDSMGNDVKKALKGGHIEKAMSLVSKAIAKHLPKHKQDSITK